MHICPLVIAYQLPVLYSTYTYKNTLKTGDSTLSKRKKNLSPGEMGGGGGSIGVSETVFQPPWWKFFFQACVWYTGKAWWLLCLLYMLRKFNFTISALSIITIYIYFVIVYLIYYIVLYIGGKLVSGWLEKSWRYFGAIVFWLRLVLKIRRGLHGGLEKFSVDGSTLVWRLREVWHSFWVGGVTPQVRVSGGKGECNLHLTETVGRV